jgi:hypothetical protein
VGPSAPAGTWPFRYTTADTGLITGLPVHVPCVKILVGTMTPKRDLCNEDRTAQHGAVLRYRSLPLGERVTVALLLALLVVVGTVMFAMSL